MSEGTGSIFHAAALPDWSGFTGNLWFTDRTYGRHDRAGHWLDVQGCQGDGYLLRKGPWLPVLPG